jgi:hypothetical protein
MSRWNTEAHFASGLGLCLDNRISGDKVLSKGARHVVNRAATVLRPRPRCSGAAAIGEPGTPNRELSSYDVVRGNLIPMHPTK